VYRAGNAVRECLHRRCPQHIPPPPHHNEVTAYDLRRHSHIESDHPSCFYGHETVLKVEYDIGHV